MRSLSSSIVALTLTSLTVGGCSSSTSPAADPGVTPTGDAATTNDAAPLPDVAPATETPAAPAYPAGPYGLLQGNVFPLLTLKGYKDGVGAWVDVTTASYFDPTGSKGFTGIYFVVAAQWCAPCNEEANNLGNYYSKSYKARGAVFATTMIEKATGFPCPSDTRYTCYEPATQAVVTAWRDTKHINFDIMLDVHGDQTLPVSTASNPVGLPHNYVIDPRTMKITSVVEGIDSNATACASQFDCCDPTVNDKTPGCCDPQVMGCSAANACPCPLIPAGYTAADVTYTCNATVGYCLAPHAQGVIDDLETVMVKNGAKPLVVVKP